MPEGTQGQRLFLLSVLMLMALAALVVLGLIFGWQHMIFSASISVTAVASLGWYRNHNGRNRG